MRKLLLSIVLLASVASVFAQKLDDVQKDISKGKYTDAKDKIDKILADPKNQGTANAWYYKGKIYAELSREDSLGTLNYDASREAFEAFKKYQELDPKNTLMILDQNVGLFQVYDIYYNRGIKNYNLKDYNKSYDNLKNAMDLEEYIAKKGYSYNGFSFPVLDTQLINLTASSAYLAKKEDQAIPYWERLADAKIAGKDYKEVYGLLGQYYLGKNNREKGQKYIDLGRQMYPDEGYWVGLEFGNPATDKERIARYQEMLQKYPDNYALNMDYSIELFNSIYSVDKKPADYAAIQDKLQASLAKTISIKSTPLANFVMSQHIYNEIYDLEDALRLIKGNTPAEAAKRRDVNAKRDKKYDELYPYAQKAYDLYSAEPTLKSADKVNLRKTTNVLIDYYGKKKQTDKVTFYTDKLKTL
ncbi:MAG TPA: hypothetical protein VGO09_00860 [Flavisolibacter sp.]|nr:hypothetical protein [Flavisolibacter sp.]